MASWRLGYVNLESLVEVCDIVRTLGLRGQPVVHTDHDGVGLHGQTSRDRFVHLGCPTDCSTSVSVNHTGPALS